MSTSAATLSLQLQIANCRLPISGWAGIPRESLDGPVSPGNFRMGRYPPGSRAPVSYTHLTLPTICSV
eukprot:2868872-Alexandrium_andersonii.AAC.1